MQRIWPDSKGYLSFAKLTKRKYAEPLINRGSIYFGTPQQWADAHKKPGGSGDIYEGTLGTYLLSEIDKGREMKEYFESFTDVIEVVIGDRVLLKSKRNMNLRAFCFYMLQFDRFSNQDNWESGSKHIVKMSPKLFADFADGMTKAEIDKLPEEEKPSMIIIGNGYAFLKRIEDALKAMGVKDEEIFFSEIRYEQISVGSYRHIKNYYVPQELYWKDARYQHQSEGRIVVNTDNPTVLKALEEPLQIGTLDNTIAVRHDDFFENGITVEIVAN